MAGIKRAFRRRLIWTLVAAVLAAATLTGCGDKDQQPETTSSPVGQTQETGSAGSTVSEPDNDAIRDELSRLTRAWLAGFAEPSVADLNCPGTNARVDVAGADGALSKDLLACLVPPAGTTDWNLRVRNLTGVPVTIWGSSTLLAWTVQPDATFDVPMVNPQFGVPITYKPDLAAGVTMAVVSQLGDPDHGLSWLKCAAQPDAPCLVGQAIKLLPSQVELGRWTVPARRIAEVLKMLWDYQPLAKAYWAHTTGKEGGTLTLRQAA